MAGKRPAVRAGVSGSVFLVMILAVAGVAGATTYSAPYAASFLSVSSYKSGSGASVTYAANYPQTGNGEWFTFANASTVNAATASLYLEGWYNTTQFTGTGGQVTIYANWLFGQNTIKLATPCIASPPGTASAAVWINATVAVWDATLFQWLGGANPGLHNVTILGHAISGCNKSFTYSLSTLSVFTATINSLSLNNFDKFVVVTWLEFHTLAVSANDGAAYSCVDVDWLSGSCSGNISPGSAFASLSSVKVM